jgi:hypothetical protein
MALSEASRVKIRTALGYCDVFRQNDPRLESAMDVIGTRPETQAEIEDTLASIDVVMRSLAENLAGAGLKQAEEIGWYEGHGTTGSALLDGQRAEGRRHCNRLSIVLGIPLAADMFGEGGYRGDQWMGRGAQYGGLIPLG